METREEEHEPEPETEARLREGCPERTFAALTVDDVYEIAKAIGGEVERVIDGCGRENVAPLVPKIVKVLELLEGFASRNDAHRLREEELLRTFENLQLQQQQQSKKRGGREIEESGDKQEIRVRHTTQSPVRRTPCVSGKSAVEATTRRSMLTCCWLAKQTSWVRLEGRET